jgi:hypothetical protein
MLKSRRVVADKSCMDGPNSSRISPVHCLRPHAKKKNTTTPKPFPRLGEATQASHVRASLRLGWSGRLSVPVSFGWRVVLLWRLAVSQPALWCHRLWCVLATGLRHAAQLGALAALSSFPAAKVPFALLTWCGARCSLLLVA